MVETIVDDKYLKIELKNHEQYIRKDGKKIFSGGSKILSSSRSDLF